MVGDGIGGKLIGRVESGQSDGQRQDADGDEAADPATFVENAVGVVVVVVGMRMGVVVVAMGMRMGVIVVAMGMRMPMVVILFQSTPSTCFRKP